MAWAWALSLKNTVQSARLDLSGIGMQWTLPVYFEQGHFGCQVPNRDRIKMPFSKRLVTHESPCQLSLLLAWPPNVKSNYSFKVSIF